MARCVMSVCGRLDCKMNAGGKCLNKTISLDSEGKCVCYRRFSMDTNNPQKNPFEKNSNIC